MVELGNKYDHNLFSIFDVPVEETKEVYERIEIDRDALRDATAALASAPLLNEPAADEEEAVPFVAPVEVRALCSHEGCKNQFQAGGLCYRHGAQQRACSMEGCMGQARKEGVCVTHGAQTRRCDHKGCSKQFSEEGSATFMVRVRGLKWFMVNAASVLGLAAPCKRKVEIWCVCVTLA